MRRVCVFCGSKSGQEPYFAQAAEAFGGELCRRGLGLVYGGGSVGLMGVVADAVLARGGEVIGVIPELLATKELLHPGVRDMRVVDSMHTRKALMADLADGFVALPGGYGTFEELLEIITWAQLGIHGKPVGILNVRGFFDPLQTMFDSAIQQGFIRAAQRNLLLSSADPAELLDQFDSYQPPPRKPWLTVEES